MIDILTLTDSTMAKAKKSYFRIKLLNYIE